MEETISTIEETQQTDTPILSTGEQGEIKDKRILNLLPYQYKKGQSGNPSGRPKGISLKEYVKLKFHTMTDDEREDFLNGLSKETIWKMAEDNPKQGTDVTSGGKEIQGVIVLPTKDVNTLETTTETSNSISE